MYLLKKRKMAEVFSFSRRPSNRIMLLVPLAAAVEKSDMSPIRDNGSFKGGYRCLELVC